MRKLIYLSHTRLDISYAVSIVSQFMQVSYEEHRETIDRILRNLKTTPGKLLMFRKTDRCIEAYILILDGQVLLLVENPPSGTILLCGAIS